jgi:hypothetical protein
MSAGVSTSDLAQLVARYATELHQRAPGHHVASPLGAWLLLALAADTAVKSATDQAPLEPRLLAAVEDVLGCTASQAGAAARLLLATAPAAVAASVAAWADVADVTPELQTAFSSWPAGTATGPIPTQNAADAWADEATAGLIRRFPLTVQDDTSLLLASALATRISWDHPFGPDEPMSGAGPWNELGVPLMRASEVHEVRLWTSPHGLLASHRARGEGLSVQSVLAVEADVSAAQLLECAHLLSAADAARVLAGYGATASVGGGLLEADTDAVFALPLGEHDPLTVTEVEVATYTSGAKLVACTAALPAWRAETRLSLEALPGLGDVARLLGSRLRSWQLEGAGDVDAAQAAVAAFDRYGFQAAAVTGMAMMASGGAPQERGLRRQVDVRFARPFVCVASVEDFSRHRQDGRSEVVAGPWHGLPVFSAVVNEPVSPQPLQPS